MSRSAGWCQGDGCVNEAWPDCHHCPDCMTDGERLEAFEELAGRLFGWRTRQTQANGKTDVKSLMEAMRIAEEAAELCR